MKYLLVLLVVGFGMWSLLKRLRGPRQGGQAGGKPAGQAPGKAAETVSEKAPVVVVECAHCGLHLPAADALPEGSRLYCSDAHRRLGPAQPGRE